MHEESKSSGRRRYTEDFRRRAIAKIASGEASLRQVSREFGVSVPTLIKWRKEERLLPSTAPAAASRAAPATDDQAILAEVQRLREETARLREERDRLRRSIAHLIGIKVAE